MATSLEEAIFLHTSVNVQWGVYPHVPPQSVTIPVISYQIIDDNYLESLFGSVGMAKSRIQFTCYSLVLKDVETMMQAVRATWQGFCSSRDGLIGDGFYVAGCWVEDERTVSQYRDDATDQVVYMGQFDIGVLYKTTVPPEDL